jgi:hypothetical protein
MVNPLAAQHPTPGVALIDRMCVNADAQERAQAQAPDTMAQLLQMATMMMQMQSQTIAILSQIVTNQERGYLCREDSPFSRK